MPTLESEYQKVGLGVYSLTYTLRDKYIIYRVYNPSVCIHTCIAWT